MGFWGAVTTALGFAEKVVPIISGIQTIVSARETTKAVKQQQQQQTEELLRQRRISEIDARRRVRVAKAQQLASQAASGAILSTTRTGIIGLETSLEAGLVDLAARTQFNIESVAAQARSETAGATGAMIGGMVTAAAGTLEFTDLLRENIESEVT